MKERFQKIADTVRRWFTQPTTELNRWERTARYWLQLSRYCAHQLKRDRAVEKAAALTYHTLFSLLPTLVLMLVVMQVFVGEAERDRFKNFVVDKLLSPYEAPKANPNQQPGPNTSNAVKPDPKSNAAANPPQPGSDMNPPNPAPASQNTPAPAPQNTTPTNPPTANGTTPTTPGAPDPLTTEAQRAEAQRKEFNRVRNEMEKNVQAFLTKLENVNFRGIGTVGLLLFIFGATGLLASIEKCFNAIYGMSKSRPWFMRLPLYYTAITLGPLVMIGGQLLQRRFIDLIHAYAWTSWFAGTLVVLSPLLSTWLVLSLLYILLPNTKVKIKPAIIGGFVASVLWVIAIEAMTFYIDKTRTTASLYGALALLPLFMLWIMVTWLIILFGLELAYALQTLRGKTFAVTATGDEPLLIDPAAVVPITAQIAQSFNQGQACTLDDLAQAVRLPTGPISRMIGQLEKHQLVNRLERNGEVAYALARPADQVKIFDLLNAMEAIAAGPKSTDKTHARKLIDQLRSNAGQNIQHITLDQLMTPQPDQPDPPDPPAKTTRNKNTKQ